VAIPVLNNQDNYDPCDPFICDNLIDVYIVSYPRIADNCERIRIIWKIDGLDSGVDPTSNFLFWSLNDQTFSNNSSSQNRGQDYFVDLNCPQGPGVLYLKVRIRVDNNFYSSEVCVIPVGDGGCSDVFVISVEDVS